MLASLFGSKCFFCKKRVRKSVKYINDHGKLIKVCLQCVPYAERRAFRKR